MRNLGFQPIRPGSPQRGNKNTSALNAAARVRRILDSGDFRFDGNYVTNLAKQLGVKNSAVWMAAYRRLKKKPKLRKTQYPLPNWRKKMSLTADPKFIEYLRAVIITNAKQNPQIRLPMKTITTKWGLSPASIRKVAVKLIAQINTKRAKQNWISLKHGGGFVAANPNN